MSVYDDMFELDDHFKELVKTSITKNEKLEAKGLQEAWQRISVSHDEGEHLAIKVEPVIEALSTIFNSFQLLRKPSENAESTPDSP